MNMIGIIISLLESAQEVVSNTGISQSSASYLSQVIKSIGTSYDDSEEN